MTRPSAEGYLRGSVFRFYPFEGWFWLWFIDPVIYSQEPSLLLLVLNYLFLLLVCVFGLVEESGLCVFGLVVENFPESQKPVEIGDLGSQGDSKIWGSLGSKTAHRGRQGRS